MGMLILQWLHSNYLNDLSNYIQLHREVFSMCMSKLQCYINSVTSLFTSLHTNEVMKKRVYSTKSN